MAEEWLTSAEAAQYLKVQPRTILKWAKQGSIPAHPLSGCKRVTWRFRADELDAFMNGSQKRPQLHGTVTLPSAAGLGGPIERQI